MNDVANKVATLMEAMPYLKKYAGKVIVIKYGGNAMINEELKAAVLQDVVMLKLLGMKPVLSHGGGPGINKMLEKLEIPVQFINGLRYTSEDIMRVVEAVLIGQVNSELVGRINAIGGEAVGLSGIGGTIFNPVVSWFITNLGWQTSYRLTALILVICILPFSLLVFKFRPDEAKGEQAYGHSVSAAVADDAQAAGELPGIESKKAYRTPTFVLLVLVSVLLQIVAALVQHVSSHEIAHGLTLEQGALVVSGIMFGAAIGKATIGILLDYLKPELTIVIYSAIGLAGWGLMAVATTPTPAIAAGFMAGLGQGVVLVALPWVIRKSFGQRDYSEILSIVSMFGAVASAIAVTAHGAVFDATGSYVPSLVGNMALYVVAAACMVIGFRMRPFKEITKQAK